jgi:hypothetical protein
MAHQPEWPHMRPEGWYAMRYGFYHVLFYSSIIYYQAKIAVINEHKILTFFTIDLFVVRYFFSLWLHLYAFFARVLILICIFARRADMGNCDVANITPCKKCIFTTKCMINIGSPMVCDKNHTWEILFITYLPPHICFY